MSNYMATLLALAAMTGAIKFPKMSTVYRPEDWKDKYKSVIKVVQDKEGFKFTIVFKDKESKVIYVSNKKTLKNAWKAFIKDYWYTTAVEPDRNLIKDLSNNAELY